ncbi:MAG: hypothetical protein HWD86_11115 [Kangiellaceae bacterium]|nr:hypothetical protein [Kangiellaceae bacterium]
MSFRTLIFGLLVSLFSIASDGKALAIEDFVKKAEYTSLKLSPDGKHLAARVWNNDIFVLVILNRKTMSPTYVFQFNEENEHIDTYEWANNERIVFTKSEQSEYDTQPRSLGQIYAGNFDGSKQKTIFGADASTTSSIKIKDIEL